MGSPKLETRLAWNEGIAHTSEDQTLWPALWNANRAVAEAYGLNAGYFGHILDAFPGFARKLPEFYAYVRSRIAQWAVRLPHPSRPPGWYTQHGSPLGPNTR